MTVDAVREPDWKRLVAFLRPADAVELVARLTALHLLMHIVSYGGELLGPAGVVWSVAGIVFGRFCRRAGYWSAMTLILFARVILDTDQLDNHFYLSMYWSGALCLCLSLPREKQAVALGENARWLLGLCMLFAVIWKILSPDYLSGAFFHFFLVADNRFHDLAKLVAGLTQADLDHNLSVFTEIQQPLIGLHGYVVDLRLPPGLRPLAVLLTWWTIVIEAVIALVFLLPSTREVMKARHLLLLVFAFSTYLVAPVKGFGVTLMLMGFANCPAEWKCCRRAYVLAMVYIEICAIGLLSYFT